MQLVLYIGFLILLQVIFFQDLKFRAVSWIVFPILFVIAWGVGYFDTGSLSITWRHFSINFLLLFTQLLAVTLYFSLKNRKLVLITKGYLGWGDILFLVCACVLFSPINFILFYLGSAIFVMMGHLIWRSLGTVNPKIPLAGMQAMMLTLLSLTVNQYLGYSFYDDRWLMNWMA